MGNIIEVTKAERKMTIPRMFKQFEIDSIAYSFYIYMYF